jgi:hypothetical protein
MSKRGDGSIDPAKLKSLVERSISMKAEVADINKDLNGDLKVAEVEHGLHKPAFNLCLSLKKMSQVKRLAYLAALDNYRHILGLDDAPQTEMLPQHQKAGAQLRAVPQ